MSRTQRFLSALLGSIVGAILSLLILRWIGVSDRQLAEIMTLGWILSNTLLNTRTPQK